jgi:GTP cyclohydrolase I
MIGGSSVKQEIDKEQIAYHIEEILKLIGEDPQREGLKETPMRVAKMYAEVFEGIRYTNDEIAQMFETTFEEDLQELQKGKNLVMVKDIPIYSYCEHHMALMYNLYVSVVYQPKRKVIGLSKIARIAEMVGKRLQLQERIGADIAQILRQITQSEDIGIVIRGEHSCMSARGVKSQSTVTKTTYFTGAFLQDASLRQEVLLLLQ